MSTHPRRIHRERSTIDAWLRVVDGVAILAGFFVAAMYPLVVVDDRYFVAACASVGLFFMVSEVTGLYRNWRGVASDREVVCALLTWVYALAALVVVGFLAKYTVDFSRASAIILTLTTGALLAASRVLLRFVQKSLRAYGFHTRTFAVVGVNEVGIRLARDIEASADLGLKLAGFFDDRPGDRTGELPKEVGRRLGTIAQLVEQARAGKIDRVYIALPMRAEKRIRDVLAQLADTTASVYLAPDFFVFELLHARWADINGLPVVSVFENPFYGVDGLVKRVCDISLAALFLAAAALPMLAIAAAIKLTSPGPVFFRQKRYGLDGREILVWKFRTMRVQEDGPVVKQATRNDPRVTPLGAILRRSSLDELPQLFNVLEGSMSLVGPRPHATAHNEQYRSLIPGYMLRHKVKPGITGLAQVSGWRGETDTLEKMAGRIECDHRYIREWSLWMDLKILFRTFFVVFSRQNAY